MKSCNEKLSPSDTCIHIWEFTPEHDDLDGMFEDDLARIQASNVSGFWFWNPLMLLYSPELTSVFMHLIGKARNAFYRRMSKAVKSWRTLRSQDQQARVRGTNYDGVLVVSGQKPLVGTKLAVYFSPEIRIAQTLLESRTYVKRYLPIPLLNQAIDLGLKGVGKELSRRLGMPIPQNFRDRLGNLFNFYLETPHAIVASRELSQDFLDQARRVKNEWYAFLNKYKSKLKSKSLNSEKPYLCLDGQKAHLSELDRRSASENQLIADVIVPQQVVRHRCRFGHQSSAAMKQYGTVRRAPLIPPERNKLFDSVIRAKDYAALSEYEPQVENHHSYQPLDIEGREQEIESDHEREMLEEEYRTLREQKLEWSPEKFEKHLRDLKEMDLLDECVERRLALLDY